jgi:hypothetical protein
MITQELIDYVKTQLSAGVAREKITSDLLVQGGWTMEQINEAFRSASFAQQVADPSQQTQASVSTDVWEQIRKDNKRSFITALSIFFVSVVLATGGRFVTGFADLLGDSMIGVFVWMMLGVLALFSFFVWLENKYLFDKYAGTTSKSDKNIQGIIRMRNFMFILNVIPFIQILGLMALMYGGWLVLIIYVVLLLRRHKSATPLSGV